MNTIIFSSATIQSWIFSIFLSIIIPLCFLWYLKRKTEAKIVSFFSGVGFSLLFSFILAVIVNILLLQTVGLKSIFGSSDHPIYSAFYGFITAGLMAFLASYIGIKYAMKNRLDKDNVLLFGLGKGCFESIMSVGTISITNLIAAAFINSMGSDEYFKKLGLSASELDQTKTSFQALADTPNYIFIMNATYYLLILCAHIGISLLIFKAITDHNCRRNLPLALFLQTVSFVPLYLSNLPALDGSLLLLCIDFIFTFGLLYVAYQSYKK